MALAIQQIQNNITNKGDQREIINQLADYIEANPSGGSSYLVAEVTLDHDAIIQLPSIPGEVIPAPGLGKVIQPIYFCVFRRFVTPYTNVKGDLGYMAFVESIDENVNFSSYIQNKTYSTNGLAVTSFTRFFNGATDLFLNMPALFADLGIGSGSQVVPVLEAVADWENKPVVLAVGNTGNFTGGHASNTIKIVAQYKIVDL